MALGFGSALVLMNGFRLKCSARTAVIVGGVSAALFACTDNDETQSNQANAGAAPGGASGARNEAGNAGLPRGGGGQAGAPAQGGTQSIAEGGANASIGGAGGAAGGSGECGEPQSGGVLLGEDITQSTTWNCPLYTLTKPIHVYSTSEQRTTLTIAPGTIIRGVKGDLEDGKLPGALIVTRSGLLKAEGQPTRPIVFTSAQPEGSRAPGDWGGVVLLGRARINVPADFETMGNVAGEAFIEGLPKSELITYGAPFTTLGVAGAGGSSGADGQSGDPKSSADPSWNCGTLRFVRIEFAGFEVASGKELNGLGVAACGSDTVIEFVQVHKSSDDGLEFFGGSVDAKHMLLTGCKDDALDWDQGYRGRLQFVAIQMHEDAIGKDTGDNAIEADGYADVEYTIVPASAPQIFNMTMLASKTALRGLRLREGTGAKIRNAIIFAKRGGASKGLVDLEDALTADAVTSKRLSIENTIFAGTWPSEGQHDSDGHQYIEADHFTSGSGAQGNDELANAEQLLPRAFDPLAPGWIPSTNSAAASDAVVPRETDVDTQFFDAMATYRGAFEPGGTDWTAPWARYPEN